VSYRKSIGGVPAAGERRRKGYQKDPAHLLQRHNVYIFDKDMKMRDRDPWNDTYEYGRRKIFLKRIGSHKRDCREKKNSGRRLGSATTMAPIGGPRGGPEKNMPGRRSPTAGKAYQRGLTDRRGKI